MYRLFKTNSKGEAEPIPFQIDELNQYADYVLPNGQLNNGKEGNGVFDLRDELSFMASDAGEVQKPQSWPFKKPSILYEIKISKDDKSGAVYVGIYFVSPPDLSDRSYVAFDTNNSEIKTSRFIYKFDKKNHLVVRGVDLQKPEGGIKPLIDSSTFYLKADLKYFLTFEVNHRDIESKLEAYKTGPIRTIVRVSFTYKMLRLNFDLGMYTEVSFFSNAVFLPAIMYNPLDGGKSLNQGSGFYYGFQMHDNPSGLNFETNMPNYETSSILDFLSGRKKVHPLYWASAYNEDYTIYFEVKPSQQMMQVGNVPMLYKETVDGKALGPRVKDKALPLGKSPVNLGLYFDLTRFDEGEHTVSFNLYFENSNDKEQLEVLKSLSYWNIESKRL